MSTRSPEWLASSVEHCPFAELKILQKVEFFCYSRLLNEYLYDAEILAADAEETWKDNPGNPFSWV